MSDLITSDSPFSPSDVTHIAQILGYMIPAEGNRPAANDERILADFLNQARNQAQSIKSVLVLYENSSLQALSQMRTPEVNALVSLTVQCYYRDDRVMADLGMEPRAPHPEGYELTDGDWSLLEPVRARGRHYREVK